MKIIMFCPGCGAAMLVSEVACDNCNEMTGNPILGQFSDEDFTRFLKATVDQGVEE